MKGWDPTLMDVPFAMAPQTITQEFLDTVAYRMNHKPRKILNYQTSYEVFMNATSGTYNNENRKKPALPALEAFNYYQN